MTLDTPRTPDIPEAARTLRIRTLNDAFRTTFVGGAVLLTSGVQAVETETLERLIHAVQTFCDFTPDNDPYGEHDFGAVEIDGRKFFWKVDTYDTDMQYASPDASDPEQTVRVLTIMLAEEY